MRKPTATDNEVSMNMLMKRLPSYPVERAIKVISGRWKAVLLYKLNDGPKRLIELEREYPSINQKVLIRQLRDMEAHGLITRTVFAEVPPHVQYKITDLGESLMPVLATLCHWGQLHAHAQGETHELQEC